MGWAQTFRSGRLPDFRFADACRDHYCWGTGGELKYEPPMQTKPNKHGHVPQLMRADDAGDEYRPIQFQDDNAQRVSHSTAQQRLDERRTISSPEYDARKGTAPAEAQKDSSPDDTW